MIPALTICQPHAWAVIHGPKRYENRKWRCGYHGPLLIHAGKSRDWLRCTPYPGQPPDEELPFGAIVGVVLMTGCVRPEAAADRYATGPWCHVYADPIPFADPIPCPGAMGLWAPREDVVRRILAVARSPGSPLGTILDKLARTTDRRHP